MGDKLTVTLENQKHHLPGVAAFQRNQHRDDGGQNQAHTSERSAANDGKRVIARHDQETRQFLVLAGKNLNKFCIYHCVSELDHFPDAFHKIQNYKSKKPAPKDHPGAGSIYAFIGQSIPKSRGQWSIIPAAREERLDRVS